MATVLGTLVVKLDAKVGKFAKKMRNAEEKMANISKAAKKIRGPATVAFGAMAIGLGAAIKIASDANEQLNVLDAAFGKKLTPTIIEWAKVTSDAVGRSELQLRDFAGTTQAMLAPMLENRDAAAAMSLEISQLAIDMGSFFNVADVEALQAIKAGLIGSAEPMRRFGVVMTQASLQAFALSEGIRTSVKDMSEAQKVVLRYQFIMDKTSDAQGDAERTAGGLANLMKRLKGELVDAAASIGARLLPVTELLVGALASLVDRFNKLPEGVKTAVVIAAVAVTAFLGLAAALGFLIPLLPIMAVAIKVILLPLLILAAAIAGIIFFTGLLKRAWEEDWGDIRSMTEIIIDGLSKGFAALADGIIDAFDDIVATVEAVYDFLRKVPKLGVSEAFTEAFEAPRVRASFRLKEALKETGAGEGAGEIADAIVDAVKEGAKKGFDEAGKTFKEGAKAFGIDIEKIGGMLSGLGLSGEDLEKAMAKIKKALLGLEGAVKKTGRRFRQLSTREAEELMEKVEPFAAPTPRVSVGRGIAAPEPMTAEELFPTFLGQVQRTAIDAGISIQNAMSDLGASVVANAGEAGKMFGGAMINAAGDLGQIMNSAIQGFQAGGPLGAIAAVLADLVTRSESFKETVNDANVAVAEAVEALDPLAEAMKPMAVLSNRLIVVIAKQLGPMFEALDPVFVALFDVMKFVATTIINVVIGIGKAWNAIVGAIQSVFRTIGQLEIFGKRPLKFLSDFADSLDRGQINMNGMNRALQDIRGVTESTAKAAGKIPGELEDPAKEAASRFGDMSSAMDDFAKSANEAAEALTNVPRGFKVALARFESIVPGLGAAPPGEAEVDGQGPTVNIGTINVDTTDPEAFAEMITDAQEAQNFVLTGATIGTGPFNVEFKGAG